MNGFSEREQQVADLLLQGKSNKDIARALSISVRTVEFHITHILNKTGVSSRTEAIVKLTSNHLRESTGAQSDEPVQSAVEIEEQPPQNGIKILEILRRPVVKKSIVIGTALLVVLIIALLTLSPGAKPQSPGQPQSQTATMQPGASVTPPAPTSTPTVVPSARLQIITEARRLAGEYDQAVQAEMLKGNVETRRNAQTGKEEIRFTGDSLEKILKLYDTLTEQMQKLNQQYLALYIAEVQPTPFPTQASKKETDAYVQQLSDQYSAWFDQVAASGPTVKVYDPNMGAYFDRVIGDAYARGEVMSRAIEALGQSDVLAKVSQAEHIALIRAAVGQPDLNLSYQRIIPLANAPWIQAAVYTDAQGTKYSVAIDAGRLAGIEPGYRPDVPALEVKPIDSVRQVAEALARKLSPHFAELQPSLSFEQGGKGDIYFFTWRVTGRDWSGTQWQMMPPFLQLGFSADGQLVSLVDTLDLE